MKRLSKNRQSDCSFICLHDSKVYQKSTKATLDMETCGPNQIPQPLAPSPFFYYNPDVNVRERPQEQFSPHPNTVQDRHHMQSIPPNALHQDAMICPRPMSAGHSAFATSKQFTAVQSMMTPVASPTPMHQRPNLFYQREGQQLTLDTGYSHPELMVYPCTPPLSVSGSTASSPPSTCGVLPTPVNGTQLFLENIEGVKEGCEGEVKTEILAGGDWSRCYSPPLTPGKFSLLKLFFCEMSFASFGAQVAFICKCI